MLSYTKRIAHKALNKMGYELLSLNKDAGNGFMLPGHLLHVFEALKINCVLDVGANEGQYGEKLRGVGYDGHIISFEPIKDAYLSVCEKAKHDPRWKVRNLALGEEDTTKSLNVVSESQLSSFLTPNDFVSQRLGGAATAVERVEVVEMRRLDSIIGEVLEGVEAPRIFLKLDTQGYDLNVLQGATDFIGQVLALQSEISLLPIYDGMPNYLQSLGYFNALGFDLTGLFTIMKDQQMLRVIEYDCVLIRAGKNGESEKRS